MQGLSAEVSAKLAEAQRGIVAQVAASVGPAVKAAVAEALPVATQQVRWAS